jgi:hypothetical protein
MLDDRISEWLNFLAFLRNIGLPNCVRGIIFGLLIGPKLLIRSFLANHPLVNFVESIGSIIE